MAKTQVRSLVGFEMFSTYIVETGLEEDMRATCLKHHVTLREVYLDTRGATVHAARLEIWWGLHHFGKSTREIGRLFARDSTSIAHAIKRLIEVAAEMNVTLSTETVHDVARQVAATNLKKWKAAGHAVATVTNTKKEP